MKTASCPLCNQSAEEKEWQKEIEHNGHKLLVTGLRHFVCQSCGTTFANNEQSRINRRAVAYARNETDGLLTGSEIRALRERWDLTQRDAARIFGGGLNAFSKYENGEVVQSDPMDKLLRLAMRHDFVVTELASDAGLIFSKTESKFQSTLRLGKEVHVRKGGRRYERLAVYPQIYVFETPVSSGGAANDESTLENEPFRVATAS
jgi:HTH-type transcriptional regulator/antitoxin MqsA